MVKKKRFEIFGTIVWMTNCKLRRCHNIGQVREELVKLSKNRHYSDLRVVELK